MTPQERNETAFMGKKLGIIKETCPKPFRQAISVPLLDAFHSHKFDEISSK